MSKGKRLCCAIYTRTSSDENLDQAFNSLHAQREACEAFIRSQASEGWHLLSDGYDDGGFSGGTMDRPALKRLLDQVQENRIDIVVVYKIDRLTRSLTDFARIVEIFDAQDVSFVSVTQAFNTTTSMGRLTLNVLLSFAQFEREVTAERIRDKIAASKKKGMWMGGNVPLGYRVEKRKLLIEESEAGTVRFLFRRYLEVKSLRRLAEEINGSDRVIRRGRPRNGISHITDPFQAGSLRHLLANPIYAGRIRHRDKSYEGEHAGIIDPELFERVQAQLKEQAPRRQHATNTKDLHLLTGMLFDETGDRLTPTQCRNHGKRYRYYVSKRIIHRGRVGARLHNGWRVRAQDIETIVENTLLEILRNPSRLHEWFRGRLSGEKVRQLAASAAARCKAWPVALPDRKQAHLRRLLRRITLRPGWIRFELDRNSLLAWLMDEPPDAEQEPSIVTIEQPMSIRRHGVESRMILANGTAPTCQPDAALIDLVVRANRYLGTLTDGSAKSISEVAEEHGANASEVSRLLPFAFLSPHLVEGILAGTQPAGLGAQRLSRIDLPCDWSQQAKILGF
ncbi:recombinase family protein [Oceanibacterium hippocampi]|uniref:DNA-invertase hin n=1 Tax=Oceanibacterium hippocampi TaxID=745714 RepID=A0A1Y5TWR7_9PROT|nr:recombinase family protein [Oceanibacterium hippocampi]SLN74228.1 DNA-invertase hin [Oceanibacterium hippocampi]